LKRQPKDFKKGGVFDVFLESFQKIKTQKFFFNTQMHHLF